MIEQVQYKNYQIQLNPQIRNDMRICLEKDNGIDIIAYILQMSNQYGYTLDRYHRVSTLIRNLFFAMNPVQNEYKKVRNFFEYSNCMIDDIVFDNSAKDIELEISIYIILKKLRDVFYQSE